MIHQEIIIEKINKLLDLIGLQISQSNNNSNQVENKLDELITNTQLPFGADYMEITSKNVNGDPLVIVYKTGGASGTVVNTTTITYDVDGDVQTVTNV